MRSKTSLISRIARRIIPQKPEGKVRLFFESVGLVLTLSTILGSVYQYKEAEKWKREEFIISQFNKFRSDQYVVAAHKLLDYTQGVIVINRDTLKYNEKFIMYSLQSGRIYEPEMYLVREIFDHYFEELSLFNRYLTAGLIDKSEIKPYFQYQFDIMGDFSNTRKSYELKKAIHSYLSTWHFEDVIAMFNMYGYDVRESSLAK